MEAIDLATQWPFTNVEATKSVNIMPNRYGRLRELNLFGAPKFIGTTKVEVTIEEGILKLLAQGERGAPGSVQGTKKPKSIIFSIPHIPHYGSVKPSDIQDRRRPGTTVLKTMTDVMDEKLQSIRDSHALTLEYYRMGAVKGIIVDADGDTVYNLYTEFGITQKVIDFALNNAATDVMSKCRELVRHMEDNLKGEVMTGAPRCLVSGEFFDALISHAKVKEWFVNWQTAATISQQDPRKGFLFGGVIFEEYRATASKPNGDSTRFIAAKEGHAFPEGTFNTFETTFAPADTINTANMPPDAEVFISQKILDHGKGIEIYSESDPLPLCKRPALLVKVTTP